MASHKMVTVTTRGWSVAVPARLHADGVLEFAAGNRRPYDADREYLHDAPEWQVADFARMQREFHGRA